MDFLEMMIRTTIVFVALYLWCRILGKKIISQITFFDFVSGITLGTISGSIMFSQNVPLTVGLVGLSLFAILGLTIDFVVLNSFKARKVLDSEPTLIVKNGKILEEGMGKTRLTMDDLLMLLRKNSVFYVDQVDIAFLEIDGTLSVLKKTESLPVTPKDLNLLSSSRGLPQTFIIDGQILENSLAAIGKDQIWVESILQSNGISKVGDVALAQIDQQNQVYIDKRNDEVH
jgi:uncharacterized membrane protein YcaP (DUF421 family)